MIKPTILVVDDEKRFTETFVDFLKVQFNANVILKENVKDALEVIDNQRVDVLFQDIHLPNGPDGVEVVKYIKKIGKDKDITTFIISKWQDDETYQKVIKELNVKYIPKPISLASTKTVLEELFKARGNFDYKKKKS